MKVELGGKRLGSESNFPEVELSEIPRSNQNLSKISRFSAQVGILYPSYLEKVLAGDTWECNVTGLFKTMPLIGPLFGSFKTQLDFFFIPTRLYNSFLHNNLSDFDPGDIKIPTILYRCPNQNWPNMPKYAEDPLGYMKNQVNPSSLGHYLGMTAMGVDNAAEQHSTNIMYRRSEFVSGMGYYDIYYNYYANQQEKIGYVLQGTGTQTQPTSFPLTNITSAKTGILQSNTGTLTVINQEDTGVTGENILKTQPYSSATSISKQMSGLCIKTHLSDKFNNWLNTEMIGNITSSTQVAINQNAFSIDSLRLANKVNEMKLKTTVSGGTFTDWLTVQYGKSVKLQKEIPEWIGSTSTEIYFEDINSTVDSEIEGNSKPLGWLSGKGKGSYENNFFQYNIKEPGFIMGIFSITPRVDYSTGNKWWTRLRTLEDDHVPALDQIGFQDLLLDEIVGVSSSIDEDGELHTPYVIGKQPAWLDYMTAVNETHGDFAINGPLEYMVLNKDPFGESILPSGNSTYNWTSYINPQAYNKIFANTSVEAENFWIQIGYKVKMSRALSKKVMPKL